MKRSIEVVIAVQFGNGDEGLRKVMKLPVPECITKMRDADAKDAALEAHVRYLESWLQKAIRRQENNDERAGIMDSW